MRISVGNLAGALVLISALLLGPAWALPLESVEWQEYPDARLMLPKQDLLAEIYPDWQPDVLLSAEYSKSRTGWQQQQGFVTVRCARLSYANLIHYSPSGRAYIIGHGLAVGENQQTTFSFALPPGVEEGVTRLMVWQRHPDASWLTLFARHPHYSRELVAGLAAERWFESNPRGFLGYPWENVFRPEYNPPPSYLVSELPLICSEIDGRGMVRNKDCSVQYDGIKKLAFDEYGGYGQWMLSWGTDISVEFELPQDVSSLRADLLLYGKSDSSFGIQVDPALEVRINGWTQTVYTGFQDYDATMQPIIVDVSQYLKAGINIMELRLGSLADSEWLLERFELWME